MPIASITWANEFAVYLLSSFILVVLLAPSLSIVKEEIKAEAVGSTVGYLADTISIMPPGGSFLLSKNLFIYAFTTIYLDGHFIKASYRGFIAHQVNWLLPNKVLSNNASYRFKLVGDGIVIEAKGHS